MDSRAEAVESKNQLISVWARMVEDRGGQVSSDNGVCRLWADSAFSFWNAVTLTGESISAGELRDQLSRAGAFMRCQNQAGFLWLFEDLLQPDAQAELPDLVRAAGLEPALTCHGMVGDLTVPEPSHPDLEFRPVKTEEELLTYGAINARAYGMTADAAQAALSGSKVWLSDAYAYIAYEHGRPVACAATIESGDALFLALVAAMPDDMRRGYGEAVTRKAIHEGIEQTGLRRVVLHATAAGRPVYERIGCHVNTPISFFQLASSL